MAELSFKHTMVLIVALDIGNDHLLRFTVGHLDLAREDIFPLAWSKTHTHTHTHSSTQTQHCQVASEKHNRL